MTEFKESTNTSSAGTGAKFGAADINKITKLLNGEADVATVVINSPFTVQNGKLTVATITNTGTLTLPTSTDTLVGRATTDTLTNKTLTSPTITTPTLSAPLTVANGGSGAATLTGIVKGNGTSAMTAVTAPTGTIVGTSDTQTLTNKTLDATCNVSAAIGAGGASDVTGLVYIAIDGSGDYTSLATAISTEGANKTYILGPGDHSLTTQLSTALSNIKIRGSGVGVTRIVFDSSMASTGAGFIVSGSLGQAKTLSSNAARGAHTLSTAASPAHGIVAGDWIYLKCTRSVQTAGNNGTDAEIHQVFSVTSTTITLKDYLYDAYTTALTSTFYKITWAADVEISDLTFYDARTSVTGITQQADTLFLFCYNLRLTNVKFDHLYYCSVALQNCYNAIVDECAYESPQFLNVDSGGTFWVNYGIDILSASTNITINGGWANRCRHSVTTDCIAGQTYGGGRQRNITVNGMESYNANTSHFDTHEGVVGMVFNGCVAIGGYHQFIAEYQPLAQADGGVTAQTDQVKGFTARSPTIFNACIAQDCENYGFALFNDNDSASASDTLPGSNGSQIVNCQIRSTQTGGSGSVGVTRGIRVLANRADVQIIGCYFFNIIESAILIETGTKNITIANNTFHSCGSILSASNGQIWCSGTTTDLIVTGNIFGAGTAPGSARPLFVTTSVARLTFTGNNVQGLTNKTPSMPAASTDVCIKDNAALNPLNLLTTPIGTSTIGCYGGTTSTITTATDYTIVGTDVMVTITAGTVSAILVKDGAGNTVVTATTTLNGQYIPRGFKLRVTHTGAPTVTVYAI